MSSVEEQAGQRPPKAAITSKDRWRALLAGKPTGEVSCDFWGTPEVTSRLMRDLGCPDERALWTLLRIDKSIHVAPSHPLAREAGWHIQSLFSLWNVGTARVRHQDGAGEYEEDVFHPLAEATAVADVDRFPWPDPGEFDLEGMREECLRWPDFPIIGGSSEPFYLYCRLRGMEQALRDLIELPAVAEAILARIFEFDHALIRRVLEKMGDLIDLVYIAEDLGTQNSLIMSPKLFRRFLKPRMESLIGLVHSFGVKVFHHNDGAIRPMLPELIEIGIDVLNPVQWRCRGMDRENLARDFGERVVFHGGIDNQLTLPFGTPDDIRLQVRQNIDLFRPGRGYIVAPCHNVQINTPTENILALYQAVGEYSA